MRKLTETSEVEYGGLEKLYDVPATAEYFRASPWTIRAWINQKRLDVTRAGSKVLISESAIRKFLRESNEKK